jgi:hypothetical protein
VDGGGPEGGGWWWLLVVVGGGSVELPVLPGPLHAGVMKYTLLLISPSMKEHGQ